MFGMRVVITATIRINYFPTEFYMFFVTLKHACGIYPVSR